jgi:hypothetical protein
MQLLIFQRTVRLHNNQHASPLDKVGTMVETMEETAEGTMAETMAVIDLPNNNPHANNPLVETMEEAVEGIMAGAAEEMAEAVNAVRAESHEKVPGT